jgi:hypothetical protein
MRIKTRFKRLFDLFAAMGSEQASTSQILAEFTRIGFRAPEIFFLRASAAGSGSMIPQHSGAVLSSPLKTDSSFCIGPVIHRWDMDCCPNLCIRHGGAQQEHSFHACYDRPPTKLHLPLSWL